MKTMASGVIVVDKPADVSSAKVVDRIKKIMGASKAGHTGTLDPFATGVLVCCLNQATRLTRFFQQNRKTYRATLILGVETDTQDATGQVVRTASVAGIDAADIRKACREFEGTIDQRPPAFSALKHKGVPLYRLARQGNPFQKPSRRVCIHSLEILAIRLPEVHLEIVCGAGTYIRTLAADIGRRLGCGGHLAALRRTGSCGFSIAEAVSLPRLEEEAGAGRAMARIIPMNEALRQMPAVCVEGNLARKVQEGRLLDRDELVHPVVPAGPEGAKRPAAAGDYLKIVDKEADLLAILEMGTGGRAGYNYCCVFPK